MNVSLGAPSLLRAPPRGGGTAPPSVGEHHKWCRPDPDEMKATWIPTHPSLGCWNTENSWALMESSNFSARDTKLLLRDP